MRLAGCFRVARTLDLGTIDTALVSQGQPDQMSPHRSSTAIVLLAAISLSGCVRRSGRNSDCKWPEEPDARTLSPNQRGYARQLTDDVEFAEELAVEYMDAHHGPRSGEFKSQQAASQALNTCLGTLIEQIAKSHNVPPREVAKFFGRRSLAIDLAMILPFLLLYVFLAVMLAGKLRRRYPPADGWSVALIMVILSSLALGVVGTMLGEQWSTFLENIRIGTGHLSYRVDRLPWVRHRISFFVLCVAVFWGVAVVRFRARQQRP
jgi:hypothetical protein